MSNNNWDGEWLPEVGQMVSSEFDFGKPVEIVSISGYQICIKTNLGLLRLCSKHDLVVIPNTKQTVRDNEIQKMTGIAHGSGNGSASEKLYDAGYRKVKPLPADWGTDCLDSDMTLNDYLIEKGYYIAEDN